MGLVARGKRKPSALLSLLHPGSGQAEMQLALVTEEAFTLFDSLLAGVVFFG
jgi:hypothetical protein